MTDTTTRVLQYRMGTWSYTDGSTMRGVEYLGEYAELASRWDWAGVGATVDFDATVQRYAETYAAGTGNPPTYHALSLPWVFTPDPEPDHVQVYADRTATGQAMAAMRRRETEALERATRAEAARDAFQSDLNRLRGRVSELNTALNEQAVERDWCGEFEEFVSRFDDLLSVEETSYTVTLTVTAPRGSNWNEYEVADHLYGLDRSDLRAAISDVSED